MIIYTVFLIGWSLECIHSQAHASLASVTVVLISYRYEVLVIPLQEETQRPRKMRISELNQFV